MMTLTETQKHLLKDNIDYIQNNEFQDLFDNLSKFGRKDMSQILLNAGIDFLIYMNTIPERTFAGQWQLDGITIPPSIKTIDNAAFFGCKNLQHVIISGSNVEVGPLAFGGCSTLSDVQFDDSVKFSALNPFTYNYELGTFTLQRVINQTKLNGAGNHIDLYGYSTMHNLTEITIPSQIESIDVECFQACTGLKEVTIEYSCKSISTGAFESCTKLRKITIPKSVLIIKPLVFYNTPQLTEIVYKGSKDEWDYMLLHSSAKAFDKSSSRSKIHVKGDNFDLEI